MPINADGRANTSANGKPSLTVDQAAAQLDRAGLSWSGQLGQPATVTYAYRASAPGTAPDGVSGFSRFTAAQIQGAELSLKAWSDVANITFVRVGSGTSGDAAYSDAATILFTDYSSGQAGAAAFTYLPGNASNSSLSGDVFVLGSDGNNSNPTPGGYGLQTLTHEIGHAIGLSHPSDYDASDTGAAITYANNASYYEDSREYSIMSYFASSNTGGSASVFAAAPQLDDIAAAQRLYGANYSTRAGDDTYGFHSNLASDGGSRPWYELTTASDHIYAAIWDGGGNDTLDFSLYTLPQKIDLHEGAFSNVGGDVGNVAIAIGAKIENAIGGYGNDLIYGNALNNILVGGTGDDTIYGGGGADSLVGGDGGNYLSGDLGADTLVSTGAADTLYGGDGDDVIMASGGPAIINGNAGNDIIRVSGGASQVYGGRGDDLIVSTSGLGQYVSGDLGNDTIVGGTGPDTLYGGDGDDRITISGPAASIVIGNAGNDTIIASGGSSQLYGGRGDDLITASGRNGQYISGDLGADTITGGDGADTIIGGDGRDVLTGGAGADRFVYMVATDSTVAAPDLIADFNSAEDRIDIRAVFAKANVQDNAYQVVQAFSGAAGQATITYDAASNTTTFALDLNGDSAPDMAIRLAGHIDGAGGWIIA